MNTYTPEYPEEPATSMKCLSQDFSIEPGLVLRVGPTVFRIYEIKHGIVTLQHAVTLEHRAIPLPRLLAEIGAGKILPGAPEDEARAIEGEFFTEDDQKIITSLPLEEFSDAQRDHVFRLMRYIHGLRSLGYAKLTPNQPTIQLDLNRLQKKYGDQKPAKAAWVYKWSLVFDRANCDPRALIPRYNQRGGSGRSRLNPSVENAIERAIVAVKENEHAKIRTGDLVKDAQGILKIEHAGQPDLALELNWSTVNRRVREEFSAYEICVRNFGKAIANKKFRDWYPRDRAEYPLEVLETDDTDAGVFLIDEKSGLPNGRANLTAVIDQNTDNLLGYELSNDPRSTWSAINALVRAILPKNHADADFAECKTGCEFYGKPGIVVFDNALYNHAKEIEEAAYSMGVIPAWAKPLRPPEKRCIEAFNGYLKSDFLPYLAGFRGNKKFREGLKEGLSSANLGLLEFRQAFNKWNFDVRANTPGTDGLTPRQRWHTAMRLAKPRLPRDVYGLKLVPCLHETLKLREGNIKFAGTIYHDAFLKKLGMRYGHNEGVRFRYNPGDLVEIYVFDPDRKVFLPIMSASPEYSRGLTLYQHRLICKMARDKKLRNPSIPELLVCREELRILTDQLRFSKKLKDRKRAARTGDVAGGEGTESRQARQAAEETVVMTDLESHILDIDEIEMDMEDEGWGIPSA